MTLFARKRVLSEVLEKPVSIEIVVPAYSPVCILMFVLFDGSNTLCPTLRFNVGMA